MRHRSVLATTLALLCVSARRGLQEEGDRDDADTPGRDRDAKPVEPPETTTE